MNNCMFAWDRIFLLILLIHVSISSFGYSVLTHEAIVDAAWEESIKPALLKKYPEADDPMILKQARAFAYGGAIMPDLGYFPGGNKMFTDLVHYVRGGDFVYSLISNAGNINELAFAYGALAHYTSDNYGHPIGVNPSVPLLYPKLKKKMGDTITFEQDQIAHRRVEFAFDVLQISRGKYAPKAFHDFIGFEIAEDLLRKSFFQTYCIEIDDLFGDFSSSVHTFRWIVTKGFPLLIRGAWKAKSKKVARANRSAEKRKFMNEYDLDAYGDEWHKPVKKPGTGATLLAGFILIVPKVGPLRVVKYKVPTPETEKNFVESFDVSLLNLNRIIASESIEVALENKDFDTGKHSHTGEYCLADATYLDLIKKLRKKKYAGLNAGLQQDIIEYFGKPESTLSEPIAPILREIETMVVAEK
ncbi:MAG: zinc dependent phospholipase C family protein [Cytophagaceae bacterium]